MYVREAIVEVELKTTTRRLGNIYPVVCTVSPAKSAQAIIYRLLNVEESATQSVSFKFSAINERGTRVRWLLSRITVFTVHFNYKRN